MIDFACVSSTTPTWSNDPRWCIPGIAATEADHAKLAADRASSAPVQGVHRYYPFVVEDRGRLGKSALTVVYIFAVLLAVRNFPGGPSAPTSCFLRGQSVQALRNFVAGQPAEFRRHLSRTRRGLLQRVSACVHGTLGGILSAAHRPRPVARTRCNAVRSQRWEVRSQPQSASESQRRPDLVQRIGQTACVLALGASMAVPGATARMEGVNKPELLPQGEFTPVIDVAGFLTTGEEARIREQVTDLEKDTGIKLRVLAQNYPETPGLAIKDYWGVDEDTVVFVADPNTGNILNFNVGSNVDLQVPRNFWTRLASKFGNKFFWQEQGEASSILNAVASIDVCLREPIGRGQCSNISGISESLESMI
eukprot:jgi/Tetstr1/440068/TSEL_028427.t1